MDIFENQYYHITRYIFAAAGQSRSLENWKKFFINSFILFIMFSFFAAQIAGLIKRLGNIDLVLECIPPVCYVLISAVIFINNIIQVKQVNAIFLKMQSDWSTLTSNPEAELLHKYGRRYRFYNAIFLAGFFGNLLIYLLSHFAPLIIDIIRKSKEPKGFIFPIEFGIDSEKYYYLIIVHSYLTGYICSIAILQGDSLLLMFLEHASGIFETIGYKLTAAIKESYDSGNKGDLQKNLHREIKLCVAMHKRVVLFISDIETVFSTAYLFVFGLLIILLSITGVQSVLGIKKTKEAIRFGYYAIFQVFHIFLLTIPTQHVLDSSLSLVDSIYNTYWYHLSTKAQKLLLIIMKRGSEPTTFVVGKIFTPSLQFFTSVLQTSMTYFTVLMSIRA